MSLIEALITVAISVLIATLSFPAMDRAWETSRQTGAVTTLTANLRVARAQAVRSGQPVALTIAPDGKHYAIGDTMIDLPERLTLRARPARLTFYPDGSATAAELTVAGTRSAQNIGIRPATGLIETQGMGS